MEENDTEMKSIPNLSKTIDPNNKKTLHQFKSANNDSEQNFTCEACQTGFSSLDTLDDHLCILHVLKRGSKCLCGLCKEEFTAVEPLKNHLRRYHTLRKIDSCYQCGAKVPFPCSAPTYSVMKLFCDQCRLKRNNRKNNAAKDLKDQFKSSNNDSEQNFTCEACQTGFSSLDTLDDHLCILHVLKRGSKCLCGLCKEEFTAIEPLKNHLRRYHTLRKIDSCYQCGAKVPFPCSAPTHSEMKLFCDQCKLKRNNRKNKAAKDLKDKNSKSVPNIKKIEQHTEGFFQNGKSGELSNFTKNENSWGQRVDGIKIVSVVGSVQQPRSRSTLGELNNFCNSYFLEDPPVMVLGGNHFGHTFSRQNTITENNISIASKNMITVEGKEEPVGYKNVLTGLNSFCNGFYLESSTATNAASHRRGGVALNLLSTVSERDISIPIIRAGSDNMTGNKMFLSVPNSYCNNFLHGSITATVASNVLPTVPERNVPNEIIITQKENEEPPASIKTSNAQTTYCNNNFCEKGSTMKVTGSHHLFSLAPNSHNTFSYQNVSIATEKLITEEESEESAANKNVPKALNSDCNNNFCEVGSTPVDIDSLHLLELTPISKNTISEKEVSIAKEEMITEEESKEPPANNNVPGALNTCYDFCEEGSTTAVADSHHLLGLATNYQNSVSEKNASIAKEEIITGEESEESSGNKKVPNAVNTYCSNNFSEKVSSMAVTCNHHLLGFKTNSQNNISDKKLSIATEEFITGVESKEPPANNNVPYALNNDCNNDFCKEISSTISHHLLGLALSSQSTVSDKNVSKTVEKMITEEESEDPLKNKRVLAELNTHSNDSCQEGSIKKSLLPHHSGVAPNSQSTVSKRKDLDPESGHIGGRKDFFFCKICCVGFHSFVFLEDHLRCTHVVENSTNSFFCETCKKVFKKLEILMNHLLLRHTMKKTYSCGKCGMQFPYPHTTTAHPRTKLYCAGRCQKIEHDVKNIKVTVNKKIVGDTEKASDSKKKIIVEEDTEKVPEKGSKMGEKETHSCEFCQEVFASRAEQLRHSRLQHSGKPYSCDLCGKKFTGSGFLKNHYLKHGQEHFCDVCQRGFSGKGQWRAHRLLHAESETHTCETCKKEYSSKASLDAHARTHNLNLPCDLCDRKFYSKTYLLDHRRRHTGEKPFACDLCDRKFRLRESLYNHRRGHSKQETHACEVCLKEFKNKGWLRVHHRTHTGERPYPCHVCDRRFVSLTYLKRHLMCHTGEKPHVCEACGRGFAKREHLKTHVRVHTGEKPYVCDFCGRGFSQKWVMYTHRRIHTGERPFECEVCQRGFIYKSEMKRHQLMHFKHELKN